LKLQSHLQDFALSNFFRIPASNLKGNSTLRGTKLKTVKLLIALASSLTFVFAAFGQIPEETPPPIIVDDGEIIKVESRLVVVPVSVLDSNGQAVQGLKASDFRILENKRQQDISEVGDAEKVPLEIAILFDISATTNAMFEFQQETAIKFLSDVMKPDDRATIFTVGNEARLIQSRETSAKSAISIRSIVAAKEQTAFYDSVAAAAGFLKINTPAGRRKVVVIISDGEDTNSDAIVNAMWQAERKLVDNKVSLSELKNLRVNAREGAKLKEQSRVLKSLQNADAVFYSINPAGSSYKLNKISVFGQGNMQLFAEQTGGTAFLPKFLPIDVMDRYERESNVKRNTQTLEVIFQQLANELRAQYLLQYYSNGEFAPGQYVDLDLTVTNSKSSRVRARQGYYVK
jgi:VWFA-related protein